mmetsp:Transcript_62394/g.158654  ORF Transcript_62394/g.158654 Transcript_62394/m.158654 type:complete len:214 (+) Transcript_62394:240-881(+)
MPVALLTSFRLPNCALQRPRKHSHHTHQLLGVQLGEPPRAPEIGHEAGGEHPEVKTTFAAQRPQEPRQLVRVQLPEPASGLTSNSPQRRTADRRLALLTEARQPAMPLPPRQGPSDVGEVARLEALRPGVAHLTSSVLQEALHTRVHNWPGICHTHGHGRPHRDRQLLRLEGVPTELCSMRDDDAHGRDTRALGDREGPQKVRDVLWHPMSRP